jgi:hypothetical protein
MIDNCDIHYSVPPTRLADGLGSEITPQMTLKISVFLVRPIGALDAPFGSPVSPAHSGEAI